MTLALAIVGCVTGICGLGWQVYAWLDARRLRVTVTARVVTMMGPTGTEDWLAVQAVSRGAHQVRAINVALRAQSVPGKIAWGGLPHPLSTIPGVIQPQDSAEAYLSLSNLTANGLDTSKPIRACVALSTGDQIWSDETLLEDTR